MAAAIINKLFLLKKKILLLILLRQRLKQKNKKNKKQFWVRRIFREREQKGEFQTLVRDLQLFDDAYFYKNFRMSNQRFELLLSWVAPFIQKSSKRRPTTSPAERLIITLRYLSTGDAQFTIASSYRVSPTTVSRIIRETTRVIWDVLCSKGYMKAPNSIEEWKQVSKEFMELWNFPNCLGAIDGKHVVIQAPDGTGSLFFNYKKSFSIVLLAVCNARYEFTLVDIGEAGRKSDSGIYITSPIGSAIDENLLNYPTEEIKIPGYREDITFPYTFLADGEFSLKVHIMRPYAAGNNIRFNRSEIIFNYRLSRARRVIENSFGILATRFRIFRRPIIADVDNVKNITKAAVALHNFLMKEDFTKYFPDNVREIEQLENIQGLVPIPNQGSNNSTNTAKSVREKFKDYFNSNEGAVLWQNNIFNP